MSLSPEEEALRDRALRVFGRGTDIRSTIPGKKAIVFVAGAVKLGAEAGVDIDFAQAALDSLLQGQRPEAEELDALATCLIFARPSLFVRNDALEAVADGDMTASLQAAVDAARPRIAALLSGIGAIFAPGTFGMQQVATGFLVGPRHLLTNRHVVRQLEKLGFPAESRRCEVRFDVEDGVPRRRAAVSIERVAVVLEDDALDIAVLELREDGPVSLEMALAETVDDTPGRPLAVIGHPLEDRRYVLFSSMVFGGVYGVKRASPGELVPVPNANRLGHDCSTLGGNSGSPVLDLERGVVVAVHADGLLVRNEGVKTSALREIAEFAACVEKWV